MEKRKQTKIPIEGVLEDRIIECLSRMMEIVGKHSSDKKGGIRNNPSYSDSLNYVITQAPNLPEETYLKYRLQCEAIERSASDIDKKYPVPPPKPRTGGSIPMMDYSHAKEGRASLSNPALKIIPRRFTRHGREGIV